MVKVTIAIPTFNRKEYLGDCIKSILSQSRQDFKIVVFDNHSDYDIAIFLASFDDLRISLVRSKENLGNRGNFRRIFSYVYDTEYVVVFHDDDTMHPEFLEREVTVMDNVDGMIFCATTMRFIHHHEKMNHFDSIPEGVFPTIRGDQKEFVRLILKDKDICFGSVMYRRQSMEDISPFGSLYSKWGDRPYLVHLAKKGIVGLIDVPLVNYRVHAGQDSHDKDGDIVEVLKYTSKLFSAYQIPFEDLNDAIERKLFFTFTTNNSINAVATRARSFRVFFEGLHQMRRAGFFYFGFLRLRGVYYFMRFTIRTIIRKFKML